MEKILKIDYTPQPKQRELHESPANEILYGGAAGPGKSHALRHEALIWALRIPRLHVYLFRRTKPELEKNHIVPSKEQFPFDPDDSSSIGIYKEQKKRWEFYNGSMIHFCYAQYESDIFTYQGAEIIGQLSQPHGAIRRTVAGLTMCPDNHFVSFWLFTLRDGRECSRSGWIHQ